MTLPSTTALAITVSAITVGHSRLGPFETLISVVMTGQLRPRSSLVRRLCTVILVFTLVGSNFCQYTATAQTSAGASPTTTQIRSGLKEILTQSEFQPESMQPGPITEFVEKIKSQLQSWWDNIRDFFRRIFRGGGGGMGTVSVVLTYTLIAILGLVAVWAIVRVMANRGGLQRQKRNSVRTDTAHKSEEDEPQLAPDDWIEQAGRCARANDFRGAFRAVFLAILLQLDRSGKIEFHRSLTNGDYVRVLRSHSPRALYELFAPLAREFDHHWYGGHPSREADYKRCLDVYRTLPSLIASPPISSPESRSDRAERS